VGSGWVLNSSNNQPVIYGFMLGPDPTGDGINMVNDFMASNINVSGNFFDTGGHNGATNAWRSIIGPAFKWPTTGNWVYITSSPIAIWAGNIFEAAGVQAPILTGRTIRGVNIDANRILQRNTAGSAALNSALAQLGDTNFTDGNIPPGTTNDIWCYIGIDVSNSYPGYQDSNSSSLSATSASTVSCVSVKHNSVVSNCFTQEAGNNSHYCGVYFGGYVAMSMIAHNVLVLPQVATGNSTVKAGGNNIMVQDNFLRGGTCVHATAISGMKAWASGNACDGAATWTSGANLDIEYDGAGDGSNWNA
jgi:hypothetical protein